MLNISAGTWATVGQGFSPDFQAAEKSQPLDPEVCSCSKKLNLRG
jgi:hypothetical protein